MSLTRRQMVRLTEAQDQALHELAAEEGCSVSDLVRRAVIRHFSLPIEQTVRRSNRQNGGNGRQRQPKAVA